MKKIYFILLLFLSNFSFGQTVLSQTVTHKNYSGASNGCSDVRLEVNYTYNGVGYSQVSSYQTIDKGSSATLTVTIPAIYSGKNLQIVSRKLKFVFAGDNSTVVYTIPNSNQSEVGYGSGVNRCSVSGTSDLVIESYDVSIGIVSFFISDIAGL